MRKVASSNRSATACRNPLCSCDPCGCHECECGAARLGSLERKVMDWLWGSREKEVSVRNVVEAFPDYAYTTIATILDRLVQKGFLRSRLTGRAKYYLTVGSRENHTAVLMYKALSSDHQPEVALRRFVESLSKSERSLLRAALKGANGR